MILEGGIRKSVDQKENHRVLKKNEVTLLSTAPEHSNNYKFCLDVLDISKRMRLSGHVARMGEGRGVYRVLVGKHEGKRPMRIPRRR